MRNDQAAAQHADLIYCEQAKNLLMTLAETIHDLVHLHQEQFQALIGGDLDSTRFDDLIHRANQRKLEAKHAYLTHLDTHLCSTYVENPKPNL